jgi:hypothetical protein
MQKSLTRILVVALVLTAATFALAADMGSSWTGWVTDTLCAAKGASASHAECATKCVKEKGAKWALVTSDKSVWVLSDQDAAAKMLGKEVTVKGTADAATKTIKVASIEPAKK